MGWVALLGEVDEGAVEWIVLVPRPLSQGQVAKGALALGIQILQTCPDS